MNKKIEKYKFLILPFLFFLALILIFPSNYGEGSNSYCNKEDIQNYKIYLDNYLTKYNVSVAYLDVNNNYNYNYNKDKVYYAASTIKTLSTIYLYEKAINDEEDLNKTLKYERKFVRNASSTMQYRKIGEEITLRDLIKYTIMVSDNTAYNMLINYIGKENLKNYGLNLGATYTLNLSDNFGSITTSDSLIYLKKLYELINTKNPLSEEIKNIFLNSDENYLKIDNYEALAKYGFYEQNFHLIGIVLTPNPYIVSILTLHGKDDYQSIIKDINTKIYTLHNLHNQKSNCK